MKYKQSYVKKYQNHFQFISLTLGHAMKGGGGEGVPLRFFCFFFFFLEDETSEHDVFCSCSFILRAHFETKVLMVSYYGYEIRRHNGSRRPSHS